ncbi:MAG: two-component system, OmpR family, phosphate regulon sensor histidine kinase PhoR [Solirubrobacterales bacterium]|jgi:signal transduction histidine kinase|nr:two-component system, OmpR family, phosphate regulon sensor histidine kinase PhoR [Solirubrobacterales bacterium]
MRFWLGAAFALVGVLTAVAVYFFVTDSSERVISESSSDIAVGRTIKLADKIGQVDDKTEADALATNQSPSFELWLFDLRGGRPVFDHGARDRLPPESTQAAALGGALNGGRYVRDLSRHTTIVAVPFFRKGKLRGAVLARGSRPAALTESIRALRGDSLTALIVAVLAGALLGFIIASAIARRVKRLAIGAEEIAAGRFDAPLGDRGPDEIGALAAALDTMRAALRESFKVLTSERDKLSSIFDGLADAVMVVGSDGEIRFANVAARPLVTVGEEPIDALVPALRRAAERGSFEQETLRVEDRVYAVFARDLPAEQAVLVVVRDRTDELRRELAEHEFVSNAAHELRNPLAGISGVLEVLRSGAKDDPEAREHFLGRLSEDVERMSRLTESLLTLARAETIADTEHEIVDVEAAVIEASEAVSVPEGLTLEREVAHDLAARGDPQLLRQVLIGLLSNAFKNTPPPGTVTLSARRTGNAADVLIEVTDTGRGIAADELDRVFERFYRGSGTLQQDGFGLGLSIAKRMVSVMDGDIGVRSKEGSGATFWVRLPVAQPTPTPVA